jgi:hypothetical protein
LNNAQADKKDEKKEKDREKENKSDRITEHEHYFIKL